MVAAIPIAARPGSSSVKPLHWLLPPAPVADAGESMDASAPLVLPVAGYGLSLVYSVGAVRAILGERGSRILAGVAAGHGTSRSARPK